MAGKAVSASLVSWRQTTSGCTSVSQSSTRCSRAFREFTFHVARRIPATLWGSADGRTFDRRRSGTGVRTRLLRRLVDDDWPAQQQHALRRHSTSAGDRSSRRCVESRGQRFLAGAFFATVFLAGAFLAGARFAGAFLAGAFFAGAFLAGAFARRSLLRGRLLGRSLLRGRLLRRSLARRSLLRRSLSGRSLLCCRLLGGRLLRRSLLGRSLLRCSLLRCSLLGGCCHVGCLLDRVVLVGNLIGRKGRVREYLVAAECEIDPTVRRIEALHDELARFADGQHIARRRGAGSPIDFNGT